MCCYIIALTSNNFIAGYDLDKLKDKHQIKNNNKLMHYSIIEIV